MYIEMCESLGSEPDPNEIPPLLSELSLQAQICLDIFMYLKDDWSGMGGYTGKDLSTLPILLELYEVPKSDWLLYLDIIQYIIVEQTAHINNKLKSKMRSKPGGETNRARSSNFS